MRSECEQLKLSTDKANQTMKTMSIKLKRAEQDPSPGKKHQQDLKKLEAQCTKLRGQLADEKSARSRAEETLEKVKSQEGKTSKEGTEKIQELSKQVEELGKDKESLQGKLQFSMNNSRRLEKDLSTLQNHVAQIESKMADLKSGAISQASDASAGRDGSSVNEELQKKLNEKTEEALCLKELAESNEKEADQQLKNYTQLIKRYQKVEAQNDTLSSKVKILTSMLKAAKAAKSVRTIENPPTDIPKPASVSQNGPKVTLATSTNESAVKTNVLSYNTHSFGGGSKSCTAAAAPVPSVAASVEPTKTPSPGKRRTRLSARRHAINKDATAQPSVSTAQSSITASTVIPLNNAPVSPESGTTDVKMPACEDDVTHNHVSHLPVRSGKRPLNTPVKPVETKRSRNLSGQDDGQSEQPNGRSAEQKNRGKSSMYFITCNSFTFIYLIGAVFKP